MEDVRAAMEEAFRAVLSPLPSLFGKQVEAPAN
jgi:hypothetical protein